MKLPELLRGYLPKSVVYHIARWRSKYLDHSNRYWAERSDAIIRGYWEERNTKSNELLISALGDDWHNALELGCACGNRLCAISQRRPDARLVGLDINKKAVQLGNQWLQDEGVGNVELRHLALDQLEELTEAYDVVFSWATLMYVSPRRIVGVLENIVRIAGKRIVLIEMNEAEGGSQGDEKGWFYLPRNWSRDYPALLERTGISRDQVQCRPIGSDLWSPGGGGGTCVTIQR